MEKLDDALFYFGSTTLTFLAFSFFYNKAVAHRLETIIDYDLVLVLGHGKVLEFGPPAELIAQGGSFASMVNDTGEAMARKLKDRAFQKQESDEMEERTASRVLSLGSGDMTSSQSLNE